MGSNLKTDNNLFFSADGEHFEPISRTVEPLLPDTMEDVRKELGEDYELSRGGITVELTPETEKVFKKLFKEMELRAKIHKFCWIGVRTKNQRIKKKNFKKMIQADVELKIGKKVSTKRIKIN